jgi:CelD/BcsL family acetyltransferase involved in cellulose biosynthesis
MDFQIHSDFSSWDARQWDALASEGVSDVPFLRYEYLKTWWQTRGGGEWQDAQLILVSAQEAGRLVGIAPLFLAEHDGGPALLLLGSIEISDYLDLIVRPADLSAFLSGLLDFLDASFRSGWQRLDWYNLPESSPTLALMQSESEKRGWRYSSEAFRPTPAITLPGDFEAYLAMLDKKQRHEIRRKLRRVEETGRARWYIVRDASALEAETRAFFELMLDDENKRRFLTDSMREQMRLTIEFAFRQGWLWLAFLEIDGKRAAAALNFDYKNKLWGYNSGVDRAFMELSPGWVLLAYSLQWAADHGRHEFDFMRGDEQYKYRFGAVNRHVMRARLHR